MCAESNGEGRKRTQSVCSGDSVSGGGPLPATPRRVSWRQKIFLRVASPMNRPHASVQRPGR
ncbi:TBC1 domain family member 4 [Liparis tanakae]|uniref:TBC1 domain family member 4 n=1 Tax=Liparis tanakae TaxID=230148 RepID=A0A4Z2HLU4_9TELE|nr:TBC1 domain family member 4 [Liparis tanakae]